MRREDRVVAVLRQLARDTRNGRYRTAPVYQDGNMAERSAFQQLVGCLVSQRVRDEQTARVCNALFAIAKTPGELRRVSLGRLQRLLYGVGFYRQKAKTLHALADAILERGGVVPDTREELVELPGIGPKCANIVLTNCFRKPVIAVDTHVHRIANRMDWVRTQAPEKTEEALTPLVPTRWRRRVNVLLVAHGQLVCKPVGPKCDECRVYELCRRRGV